MAESWEERWRRIVRERDEQAPVHPMPDYWDRRAAGYARSVSSRADPFLEFLKPWCDPGRTLIDVGAGTGRHAVPLADRLDWVTAVEPSTGMRGHIADRDNLTVIASGWMDAEVQTADLVICAHVMYGVHDPVPFLRKLQQAARLRVFVYMRDQQMTNISDALFRHLTGEPRRPFPEFADLWNLLREMGVRADAHFVRYPSGERFADLDAAVEEARARLGPLWDEERGRRWLESNLWPEPEGTLLLDGGEMVSGVAHWTP